MQAELLDIDFEAELRAWQARRARFRTPGRHLSDIIHHVIEKLEPERFGGGGLDPALVQGGFLWEDVLSHAFGKQFGNKQIELEVDGGRGPRIFMTLDGFTAKRWRVIEYKATKMSARNNIRSAKFFHWHMQIMAYCLAMGTFEAELIPLFINGSYEMGGGRFGKPVVGREGQGYLMTYTRREMVDNWEIIVNTNEAMGEAA